MKPIAPLALAAGLAASLAAFPAAADSFTDQIVSDLQGQGFEFIEIQRGLNQVKVEAIDGTRKIEVIYDRETGAILKQERERADADEIGRSGVEIRTRFRDFLDMDRIGEDDDDDDDGRGGHDDDDDDDDRRGRDDDHDDDHDDDPDDDHDDGDDDGDDDRDDDRSGRGGGDDHDDDH